MGSETFEITQKRPSRLIKPVKPVRVNGGPITQKDLARLAGVSLTTVYNTLHAKDLVQPETRERIHRLMEEYDYQPNGIARAMVKGKTEVIGILVPRIDIRYYSEIVAAIENSVNNSGYNCFICQHLDDMVKEEREIRMMRERRVDGMIIRASGRRENAESYHQLKRTGIPFVLIDRTISGLEENFVGSDGLADSREITEYLIRKGHRRIAVAVWPESSQGMGVKYEGYRQALDRHGIALDERLTLICSAEYYAGRDETLEMMRRVGGDKPTAILSLNDTSVIGVIQALMELGMSIPDDVAVANIGGHIADSLGALSRLRLTCSVQPCQTIGREAARMLSSQIEDGNGRRGPVLCPAHIRVGNSA
jgi:LacI family transcriptional regulator